MVGDLMMHTPNEQVQALGAALQQVVNELTARVRRVLPDKDVQALPIVVQPDGTETRDLVGYARSRIEKAGSEVWESSLDMPADSALADDMAHVLALSLVMLSINQQLHLAMQADHQAENDAMRKKLKIYR